MRPVLTITRALADESRLRVLLALRSGELCVCQLIELLGLAPSTVSKHMAILVQADLITCRKEGRWHYYQRADGAQSPQMARLTLEWLDAAAGNSPQARADQKRLKTICRKGVEEVSACCYRGQ